MSILAVEFHTAAAGDRDGAAAHPPHFLQVAGMGKTVASVQKLRGLG